ncbi:MAG: DNA-protecting protein DprA, partial [Lentisphaerae bacterium]|nr:DNA-protecting protein DprA [Lentisphaerota bacterium]
MDQREAYILLNMMEGVGPVTVRNLADALGAPDDILQAPAGALTAVPGVGNGLADKILRQRETLDAQREIKRAAEMGLRLITPADGEYPEQLKQIHDPPLALYV